MIDDFSANPCPGAGGGTTALLRTLTAQLLHHGAHAVFIDSKRISHQWAKGLPAVTCRAPLVEIGGTAMAGRSDSKSGHVLHRSQDRLGRARSSGAMGTGR